MEVQNEETSTSEPTLVASRDTARHTDPGARTVNSSTGVCRSAKPAQVSSSLLAVTRTFKYLDLHCGFDRVPGRGATNGRVDKSTRARLFFHTSTAILLGKNKYWKTSSLALSV